MRLILTILLIGLFNAEGQIVINASAPYRPRVVAANLLLDDYPNAAAAYSLRKLDKDYTGAAIRVRKDTTGQPEQDIFFVGNELDTAALKSFLNARSGFIVTWYDQSGNGRNATQSTASNQPRIANLGVIERNLSNKLSIYFNASASNRLIHTMPDLVASNYFFTAVVQTGSQSSYRGIYSTGTSTNGFMVLSRMNTSVNWGTFGGVDRPSTQNITDRLALITMSGTTNSSGSFFTNGVATGTYAASQASGIKHIGGDVGQSVEAEFSELIVYSSNQSSNRIAIENNITTYHNIYTPIWNGDFTGILDTYGSSAAAYSLRNLSSTYKGPLIRVRKDTTGQPEMDIYGDYYGNLDTVGLKNFLLTRSGFVTTWYDQSGLGRNASQTTQANQPRIALNGVIDRRSGDIAAVFDGSNDYLENNINGFAVNNISHYAVSSRGNDADALRTIYSTGILSATTNGFGFFYSLTSAPDGVTQNRLYQQIRNAGVTAPIIGNYTNTINTNNLIFGIGTSTTDYTYYNGGSEQTATHTRSNVTSNGRLTLGTRWDASGYAFYLNGTISEVVLWQANQSSNRTGIQNNINTYYSIY